MKKIMISLLVAVWALCTASVVRAEESLGDFAGRVWGDAKKTFNSPEAYDLYVPFYAWHNRLAYDQEHLDRYNENAWGIGGGVARKDDNGNEDRLFFVAFEDSNHHPQTAFGYGWLKHFWESDNGNWQLNAGWALTLMQRQEYMYIPVPVPLPMAGVSYKNIALEATYVPGVKNDGNVLFTWLKYRF